MLKIVVDAMGGDFAPEEIVAGAVKAVPQISGTVVLVGDEEKIKKQLDGFSHPHLEIVHADKSIPMDEKPAAAIRKYIENSSIAIGLKIVKESGGVFISAGNSGAVMALATAILERISGVIRPAIAVAAKGLVNPFVLIDAGANTVCSWKNLCQFAIMGSVCAKRVFSIENPRIALLSNGSEPTKGTDAVISAHTKLKESGLNFVGNVEGNDILSGNFDCLVCDGFVGNVVLKFAEGFVRNLKNMFSSNKKKSITSSLVEKFISKLFQKFNYQEYGASLLLGLKGTVMITHGAADRKAMETAIINSEKNIDGEMSEDIYLRIQEYAKIWEE